MAHYEVNVTQEDIDKAFKKDSARCVVAQAIARTFPKAGRISVDIHGIRFTDGAKRYTYLTPPLVEQYVVAFDAGETIHPFRFRLRTEQRLVVTRSSRNDAGKRLDAAREKERRMRRTVTKAEADPDANDTAKTLAREKLAAAEANRRVVEAETASKPKTKVEDHSDVEADETGRPPVKPRSKRQTVHGRNTRQYGHRLMRINQPEREPGDFRGPLDVDQG